MNKIKVIFALAFFSISFSPNIFAYDMWNKNKEYKSGEIVEWSEKLYISSHWTKGVEPIENNINWDGWIFIDKKKLTYWNSHEIYTGGEVVVINDNYYLASWWNKNEYPETSSAWRHLTNINFDDKESPKLGDGDSTIEGSDADDNGIRDDYEISVRKSYPDEEIVNVALSASHEWKTLLQVSLKEDMVITKKYASDSFSNLIALNRCFIEIKKNDPSFDSPTKLYFNTLERALEKRSAENKLFDVLSNDLSGIKTPDTPCVNLTLVK
ncbi:hypothetical protein [Vibrio algivorus]|uniref:Chitin-binding type-3 domain-containing protein n=1 Tax=Vibrio algivorus TaxID=1667024 RepID=A0A557P044_9VIBR|nr:hypothetical protein [Vibrio algivorus]TVO34020.1 hypothetical protein FOF44_14220 [Vibrio algivorus]